MGCDFSNSAKEEFFMKLNNLEVQRKKIKKRQEKLKNQIFEFDQTKDCPEVTQNISKALKKNLKKVEHLVIDIKSFHSNKSKKKTLSGKSTFRKTISPEPISSRKSNESPNKKERALKSSPHPESILEDPEILAMIMKNRQLLMRQLTR